MIASIIGAAAATLSVSAFAPQAWRVIRTRQTQNLATMMWVANVVAFTLWMLYGVLLGAWTLIVPNAICLVFSIFILGMKLLPSSKRHAVADVLDPAVDAGAVRRGEAPAPARESQ